jgi:Predicted membrane protein
LWKLQKNYLIDLEDAVVVTKNQAGKIKLHQAVNLTATGAVSGGFGVP